MYIYFSTIPKTVNHIKVSVYFKISANINFFFQKLYWHFINELSKFAYITKKIYKTIKNFVLGYP